MNLRRWTWLKQLLALLETPKPDPAQHTRLIVTLQRHIILPTRLLAVAIVIFQLYTTPWLSDAVTSYAVVFETIQNGFAFYVLFILGVTVLFYVARKFPPRAVQWLVFAVGLADGMFLGALTVLTGGFESILYWGFTALIVLNAISIPLATPQILLNLSLAFFFVGAGYLESSLPIDVQMPGLPRRPGISAADFRDPLATAVWLFNPPEPLRKPILEKMPAASLETISNSVAASKPAETLAEVLAAESKRMFFPLERPAAIPSTFSDSTETPTDPNILRVVVLVLLTFCCYGMQLLVARERRIVEDRQEFIVRTGQLRSAGRLAAEIAHQIKNPLTVINNVSWSLKKALERGKPEEAQQLEIIREEVAKADRVITQIMGYAQLSEGRVENIKVVEEINHAIEDVFPPGAPTETRIIRDFSGDFPSLHMQPRHFLDAVGNLLQNARDAVEGRGEIYISARSREDFSVEIVVRDTGPGIPPDKMERVFEAYYTTKTRGTGLGLAVVKHNAELYGGSVRVESELGKGARFTLIFPAKTFCEVT